MSLTPDEIEAIASRVSEMIAQRAIEAKQSAPQKKVADIDWTKIRLPIEARRINQSGTVSAKDFAMLSVAAKLLGKGLAAVVQTALITYLRRNREEHLKMLDFVASREDISREEAFTKIFNDELKP